MVGAFYQNKMLFSENVYFGLKRNCSSDPFANVYFIICLAELLLSLVIILKTIDKTPNIRMNEALSGNRCD